MLGLIAVLLVILWLFGMITPAAISTYFPVLLVVALVVVVIRLISGRHAF